MQVKYSRPLAVCVLISIVIYGILKNWVLGIYASFLEWLGGSNSFFELIKDQALQEEKREQTLGWLLYYPTYFLLHIAFIYLLFSNNKKVRNYLMIGLTGLIAMIVILWILFQALGMFELANFFRDQFRNLFGLPFILLAIEGGRILYIDLKKLVARD